MSNHSHSYNRAKHSYNWPDMLLKRLAKLEQFELGKSLNYFWVQPEHYVLFSNSDTFKKMKSWCKDSLGYCNANEPKFRFYFKTEADRTAFIMAWCFDKKPGTDQEHI